MHAESRSAGVESGKRSRLRRWGLRILLASAAPLLALLACDWTIRLSARPHLHDSLADVPFNRVGLVLGTSDRARGGGSNLFFRHRIAAAAALYHAGKVEHLLVSGDNGTLNYNEPWRMRRALIAAGVDSARITLDFAGFRTLDSVVRAREVFGLSGFTVISQRFHNERAVFLARRKGIDAIGFNAADPPAWWGIRTWLRERLARVKVFIDLLTGTQPRFLGDPVSIPPAKEEAVQP